MFIEQGLIYYFFVENVIFIRYLSKDT